jgi:heat shock protein HtpX
VLKSAPTVLGVEMKRNLLFLLTNFAVLILLGVVLNVLMPIMGRDQSSNSGLLLIFAVFGMGGSFISLALSKWIAKRSVGAQVIEKAQTETEKWLIKTVNHQSSLAGIGMPDVAIYQSPNINACATGMNRNNVLVAVSTGLLASMSQDEAEAVLGREISHIANGGAVTLPLIQGVLNTFVFLFTRLVASALDRGGNDQFAYFI